MPAKKKISREDIIGAAAELLRESGIEGVNTRKIAKRLNCSTQPIYSEFENMEQLKTELKRESERRYVEIVRRYMGLSSYSSYLSFGLGFIRFAKDEKEMFRYLYMRDRHGKGPAIEDVNEPDIIRVITQQYGCSEERASHFHHDMAVYCYGLAVMLNTGYLDAEDAQIVQRLQTEFAALASVYKLNAV